MNINEMTLGQIKEIGAVAMSIAGQSVGSEKSDDTKTRKYVIVRTQSAGVFAGNIESRNGQEVVLKNARRLWYWKGAASLSQLANEGVKCSSECKFPKEVPNITLLQAIEILDTSADAEKNIKSVPEWKM